MWEQVKSRGHASNRPSWWDVEPGVYFAKSWMVVNQPLMDVLQVKENGLILVFTDKPNNCFGIRTTKPGEESGGYAIKQERKGKQMRCSTSKKLLAIFPWIKPGMCFKTMLEEAGGHAMMVVRHKL